MINLINSAIKVNDVCKLKELLTENQSYTDYVDINGNSLLINACNDGKEDIVECLLSCGANIHFKDRQGNAPLTWAAMRGNIECLEVLISHGADLNMINNDGLNALMIASNYGEIESVRTLLERGADPSAKDGDGKTAYDLTESEDIQKLFVSIS